MEAANADQTRIAFAIGRQLECVQYWPRPRIARSLAKDGGVSKMSFEAWFATLVGSYFTSGNGLKHLARVNARQ